MPDISKHFSRYEFACKCGCGFESVDIELVAVLEDLREHFGMPIVITSGNRCNKHNIAIKGATHSKHTKGIACDFKLIDYSTWPSQVAQDQAADYLENKYQHKYGIGRYNGRTHVDVRATQARWDERK